MTFKLRELSEEEFQTAFESGVASGLYYHVAPATHAPSIEQNGRR